MHNSESSRSAPQEAGCRSNKESDVFEIKREMTQGGPFSSLLFSTVLQAALKDDLTRWRERGMGIRLGDSQADCLSNIRFADDLLLFSTFQEKHRECGAENPPGQDRNSQQSGVEQKKRGVHRQHQSRSITSERMFQVSRTNNNVRATRNNGNQESIPSSLGIIYQVRTSLMSAGRSFVECVIVIVSCKRHVQVAPPPPPRWQRNGSLCHAVLRQPSHSNISCRSSRPLCMLRVRHDFHLACQPTCADHFCAFSTLLCPTTSRARRPDAFVLIQMSDNRAHLHHGPGQVLLLTSLQRTVATHRTSFGVLP